MAEREVVLDKPVVIDEQGEAIRKLTEKAEQLESELAKLKGKGAKAGAGVPEGHGDSAAGGGASGVKSKSGTEGASGAKGDPTAGGSSVSARASAAEDTKSPASPSSAGDEAKLEGGEEELRKDSMMAHLLDSLAAGKDIGHYGRLVFAMVARHFMPHEEVLAWMTKDQDFGDEQARLMLVQVEGRDYSPPKRARIVEWQAQQEFPILPYPEDPDCGNLYRNLKFPEAIYSHIGQYQEKKIEAGG